MTQIVLRVEIRGRVQGVGYRWSMAEQASRFGVRGWVHNRRVGSVEATLAGAQGDVDQLMAWARQGPAAAAVESVEVFDAEGEFRAFEQLPSV